MNPTRRRLPHGAAFLASCALGAWFAAPTFARTIEEQERTREAIAFFEREVRPLLAEHCYECHGPDAKRAKGGLRFGSHAALIEGGDSGPAISLDDPRSSLLLHAVTWSKPDLEMPPDGKLGDDAIATLSKWIELGAPWPDGEATTAGSNDEPGIDIAQGRTWWSFQPVTRREPPSLADSAGIRNPIDAFIRAELAKAELASSPEADRRTLARRIYFDLLGLPPTNAEVERFVADPRENAFEALIDELLARPEYGERWARHWLDVVRYADTCGYERDQPKLYAWRYRDYVVDAWNDDMPFHRFIVEQIAGDEIDEPTTASRVATGIYRLGAWDSEPDDKEVAKYDELDDSLRVISEGFLGVTIGCARCHDHKFDPFPQTDYYSMLAFLRGVRPYEELEHTVSSPVLDLLDPDPDAMRQLETAREKSRLELESEVGKLLAKGRALAIAARLEAKGYDRAIAEKTAAQRTPNERRMLTEVMKDPLRDPEIYAALGPVESKSIKRLRDRVRALANTFTGDLDWGLVVKEEGRRVAPTHLLIRGQPGSPAEEVSPRFPLALVPNDALAIPPATPLERSKNARSSGRRRVLAEWIASKDNPLTARVIVNRVWHHHFGRGIVATTNDFGTTGDPPSHPELLDWLAHEFMANGWSLKWLHRTILSSATWRQTSNTQDERAQTLDPDNRWLWRQNPRRLEAEAIRDAMLAVSGTLSKERGGPGFFFALDRNVLAGSSRPGEGWAISSSEERQRRSLYAYVKRNLPVPFFEAFDSANPTLPTGARATTTVPSQALTLLNGAFAGEIAESIATNVAVDESSGATRGIFETVLGRSPTAEEITLLDAYLASARSTQALRPSAIFQARIPRRVGVGFLETLGPADIQDAPRQGFTLVRGRFDNPYNVTVEMNDLQGPAALWDDATVETGKVSARLRLRGDAPFGSLVVRARPHEDGLVGLEARLDRDQLRLLHHTETATRELAAVDATFAERWIDLRVELFDGQVSIFVDNAMEPVIAVPDPSPGFTGKAGFKTRDAGIDVAALRVENDGTMREWIVPSVSAQQRALSSLALILINTNEFVTVD